MTGSLTRRFSLGWATASSYLSKVKDTESLKENASYAKEMTGKGLRRGSEIIKDRSLVISEAV